MHESAKRLRCSPRLPKNSSHCRIPPTAQGTADRDAPELLAALQATTRSDRLRPANRYLAGQQHLGPAVWLCREVGLQGQ
eukprot:5111704-Prymnesium_polylepis.1